MIGKGMAGALPAWVGTLLVSSQWIFGTLAALTGAATKAAGNLVGKAVPTWVLETVQWAADNAWWLVGTFTVFAFLCKEGASWFKAQWVWDCAQMILNVVRDDVFAAKGTEPTHHHRVTLFRHCKVKLRLGKARSKNVAWPWGKKCNPWSGWLYPVRRSGHTSKNSEIVFLAPDDADRAEGVAGRIWSQAKPQSLHVPKGSFGNGDTWDEQTKRNYEKATHLPSGWLTQRGTDCHTLALSFWGIPIEVKGQRWGVLLIDSRSKNVDFSKINEKLILSMLDKLLQKV